MKMGSPSSSKEELAPEEVVVNCWDKRAEIGGFLERFFEVAHILDSKKVIGRFSTFLEHVKPSDTGKRVSVSAALPLGRPGRPRD